MKILSKEQILLLDEFTIANEPISSIKLMERAASKFCDWYTAHFQKDQIARILCGPGNNGGDGLAIARILFNSGYKVEVDLVNPKNIFSDDAEKNLKRLPKKIPLRHIKESKDIPLSHNSEIIIDALFGSGLNRQLKGVFAQIIHAVNNWGLNVISVDLPSGVFCDYFNTDKVKLKASYTVSFQLPKIAFFLQENYDFIGKWTVLDIGLSKKGIQNSKTKFNYTLFEDVEKLVLPRVKYSHKGSFGHLCIVAGSKGKMGAAILAGSAALHSGLGLLTLHVPAIGYNIIQTTLPEAMCETDSGENYIRDSPDLSKYNALAIGPGIDQKNETLASIEFILNQFKKPIVIDADALNILSKNEHLLNHLSENCILTPHPGEFKRLAGEWTDDTEKYKLQKDFSKNYKCILVLKGANTSISDSKGNIYINSTGNPGMATAGSGDVLTGIIAAQLAKNLKPLEAAILGVYLHGLAGDLALNYINEESLISSDIIDHLSDAFNELKPAEF